MEPTEDTSDLSLIIKEEDIEIGDEFYDYDAADFVEVDMKIANETAGEEISVQDQDDGNSTSSENSESDNDESNPLSTHPESKRAPSSREDNELQPTWGEDDFQCTICFNVFVDDRTLQRHMISHSSDRPFKCEVCEKTFKRRDGLVAHWKIHNGGEKFRCVICRRSFYSETDLETHIKLHESRTVETTNHMNKLLRDCKMDFGYRCCICLNTFTSGGIFLRHFNSHKNTGLHKCVHCNRGFKLKHHLKTHYSGSRSEEPLKCESCDETFYFKCQLVVHTKFHQSPTTEDTKYIKKEVLKGIRKNTVHDNSDKKEFLEKSKKQDGYHCSECSKVFGQSRDFLRHYAIHFPDRPYECHICGKTYKRGDHLNMHYKSHIGEKKFNCEHCHRAFYLKSDLDSHLHRHYKTKRTKSLSLPNQEKKVLSEI